MSVSTLLRNAQLQSRVLNFSFQFLLLFILAICSSSNFWSSIPAWIFCFQIGHYALIAITDIYEDDFPESNHKKYMYLILVIYFIMGIVLGLYENEFIRLHFFVVLMGNWLGGKIDTLSWKIVFGVYLSTIVGYEVASWALIEHAFVAISYAVVATAIICLCERLSEKSQKAWLIHSCIFFIWAMMEGAYYQEGILFILGGLGYETAKITFSIAEATINDKYRKLIIS